MMKSKSLIYLVVGFAACAVLVAGGSLFVQGPLGEYLKKPESISMLLELMVFSLWNFYWLSRGKVWHRCAGVLASFVVFFWLHRILVPILVSGIYLGIIIAAGRGFRRVLNWCNREEAQPAAVLLDFLAGYTLWILIVCLLSLANLGSIRNLRIVIMGIGGIALLYGILKRDKVMYQCSKAGCHEIDGGKHQGMNIRFAAAGCLFLFSWMIQIGRLNIAMDYDSLHYGLRSSYILDNGRGIYENLGNINLVYTYSKGIEVLSLPLAGTSTYGYVLALNVWITVLVMAAVYLIANHIAGKKAAWEAVLLSAGIPALMNMAITAKSDNLTLLFQLICVYGFCMCLKRRNSADLLLSLAAYLLSLTLKPTAIVFGTALLGISGLYLLYQEKTALFKRLSLRSCWWALVIAALGAWLLLWGRTWLLTGVPVTSVFTGLLERAGFQVKAPFAFMSLPSNGTMLTLSEGIRHLFTRLYGILFAPVGEDMAHVIIAWGGGMTVFLLAAVIVLGIWYRRERDTLMRYLGILTVGIGLISLLSLYLLWQIDGNYYQLLYLLVVLLAAVLLTGEERNPSIQPSLALWKRGIRCALIPLFCFQLLVSTLTNWAGITGLTPMKIMHKGWYDHLDERCQRMYDAGNQQIWNILAADPRTRVIGFGEHPDILGFPCNIQSYYDVTGSGGNVWLVKKLDYFKDFLRYAQTEYIYVQSGYLEPGTRAEEVVRFMIEDGSLTDIINENGNLLGRVVLEPLQSKEGDSDETTHESGTVE